MRLRQLRFLVAVVEEGSFTAAAGRMHATQSGVSAQIKLLEESLNARLFDRSVAGVVPTAAGKLAYQRATKILRETTALMSDLATLQDVVTGTVSAGLMPTTTRSVVAPVLERFAARYPEIELKLEEAYSAHLCEGVVSGRLDFAIVPPSSPTAGLHATHLDSDVEVFVTSSQSQRKHLAAVDLTKLPALKLILPGPENARRLRIEETLRAIDVPIDKIMELDAMMATLDLVTRSDWVTIVPGCLVINDVASGVRNLHPIKRPRMSLDYVLVEQASRTLSPAAQLLRDELRNELAEVCRQSRSQLGASEK
ncbi:MAG: LysR family transcriptional regulator [Granulosicoccus sp.]|nr:LysR family transcriptional regulator [Granulosicoccus sp.]